jgi:pimeloyl-ACP methyl ester carboxylesterase
VKFPLFTNTTRHSPQLIDISDLSAVTSASVSKNHPIYVISHGFLELGNAQWLIDMMNELLDFDNDAAVIVVDWRGGSSMPYYQAVANIRVAGAVLAHLITGIFLELEMENLDGVHLIGHSLGENFYGF